jgi:predicted ribosomally synthesized peptide with SipW-like signal peptide
MRKKLVALAVVVLVAGVCVVGGTLAYFTDTDTQTNTFTVGNVAIALHETDGDGNEFVQAQVLLPGAQNAIDKVVTVENTGTNDAYCWIEVWVPTVLDGNGLELVYHDGVTTVADRLASKEVDGIACNGYVVYNTAEAVASGSDTGTLLEQVYLNGGVSQGQEGLALLDGTDYTGAYEVTVVGIGIQADGIDGMDAAMDAYYGTTANET